MKRFYLIFTMLLASFSSFSQYRIDWQNCYGTIHEDNVDCIERTDDGFILGGIIINNAYTWSTGTLIKIDNEGDTIWQKTYDKINGIGRVEDGNYMVMYTDTLLYPNAHFGNIGFRKIDADGNTIWERAYGNDFGMTVGTVDGCATSDGGFVGFMCYNQAGGDISHYWGGTSDVWVVKVDGNGDMVWETCVGTTGSETASSIQQTADGGFLLTVTNIVPGTGNIKCKEQQEINGTPYLVKLTPNGNVEWSFCFGGSESSGIKSAIVLDDGYLLYGGTRADDGDFEGAGYHLGYTHGQTYNPRTHDAFLMKTDFDMNTVWCRCYGGRGEDGVMRVFQNEDGGFTVFAATSSIDGDVQSADRLPHNNLYYIGLGWDVSWIFRVDADGELLWERVTGGNDDPACCYPYDVIKHNDREYTVASQMTYYDPSWPHYDIDCPYNVNMPGSGQNFWVYHITDIFDYNDIGEVEGQNNTLGIEVHPNPASASVAIDYTLPEGFNDAVITLTNSLGLAVYTQTVHGLQGQDVIDTQELPVGVYILTIRCEDHSLTEKVVVAR